MGMYRVLASIGTSVSNLFEPPTTTGGVNASEPTMTLKAVVRHLRVINTTNAPINVNLYIGATAGSSAGTEFAWSDTQVPADAANNNFLDWYGEMPMVNGDFLTGNASATGLTINVEYEIEAV